MKRIFTVILIAVIAAVTLCSCLGSKDVEGGELIRKARTDYAELGSAKVIMTNTATGEIEQEFTFKYDEKNILIYSYKGKSEKNEYAQFNNGVEMFTFENGKLTHTLKGEKGYQLYVRGATHPQADEGLILYSPDAVSDAAVTEENGVTHIRHIYNVDKINAQSESGKVTGFSADYYFKGEELQYFVETTETEEDGNKKTYAYRVDITEKNSVASVENTVKQYEDKSENNKGENK